MTNANTFSAGMTIAAGTVEIGNASALGTGTVTMTGGKLSSSSTTGYSLANALTLNGTITLGDTTNNGVLTVNGTTTLAGATALSVASTTTLFGQIVGTGTLIKSGSADLFLTSGSAGTNTGTVTHSAGTLYIGASASGYPNQIEAANLVANSPTYIRGGLTFNWSRDISGTGDINIRNNSSNGIAFFGSMSGYTGSLRLYADSAEGANVTQRIYLSSAAQWAFGNFYFLSGSGLTTLSQTLSYGGTAADLTYGGPLFIQPGSGTVTALYANDSSNGRSVTNTNVVWLTNTVNATFRIAATSGPITLSNSVAEQNTGILTLTKTGTSAATLSGTNNYRGSVFVSQGTLNANSATALGLATSTAGISVTSGATLSLGMAATYTLRTLTIAGTGSASAPNNGALIVNHTLTSTFGGITLGSTTYIRATSSGSINAPFTPNSNSVTFGASSSSDFIPFASLSNVFSGTGSVTYGGHSLDTGIVRADVRHTYTGNTTLAFGTTYVDSTKELAGTGGPLGNRSLTAAGSLLMTGGTLSYLDGNVDYSGRFSTAGGQQWRIAAGTATTFATALVGASSFVLSGGSLTLSSASSTFSGGVTISAGTLYAGAAQNGVSGPLGITGTITFSPAGTGVLGYTASSAAFDYSSRFATTSGQTRRINANGESVTFSTAMGGTNAFALVGSAGILTLAVANTYSQGTTLSVGVLKCGDVASLGTGALAQANGTTLHVTATNGKLTVQGAHTNTGSGIRTIRIGA